MLLLFVGALDCTMLLFLIGAGLEGRLKSELEDGLKCGLEGGLECGLAGGRFFKMLKNPDFFKDGRGRGFLKTFLRLGGGRTSGGKETGLTLGFLRTLGGLGGGFTVRGPGGGFSGGGFDCFPGGGFFFRTLGVCVW